MKVSGQGWARGGLAFGASLSVLGNVAHTVLAESGVSLWLRVPFAVVWPVALFIGIEVLVRIDWRRAFVDHAGRVLLWGPTGSVAAVVSYLHLHDLMTLAGESWFAALVGPLAVDGLMIGCTVALLAIRAATLAPIAEPTWTSNTTQATDTSTIEPTITIEGPPALKASDVGGEVGAKVTAEQMAQVERRTRAGKPEVEKAVRLLLDGFSREEAMAGTGVSLSTINLYGKVMRLLRDDPMAEIGEKVDGRTVRPELVAIIRDAMNRERAL